MLDIHSAPDPRAFEMTMCTLKARKLGGKVAINFEACKLQCGDSKAVDFRNAIHSV